MQYAHLQILLGLHHCHRHNIVHRDLKPQNLLTTRDGRVVKLADFGLARSIYAQQRSYTREVVTLWYRAPELLLGEHRYTPAVDTWSVACIIAELATKRALFPGLSEIDQLFKIFKLLGTPTETMWPYITSLPEFQGAFPKWAPNDLETALGTVDPLCADLLTKMLKYDPAERISVIDAIWHPFFDDVRSELSGTDPEAIGFPVVTKTTQFSP